jgi:hypothetical protein
MGYVNYVLSVPFLKDLIPHEYLDETASIENKKIGLKTAIGILQIAEKTVSMLPFSLRCSDGPAADNACQIRAIEVAILAQKFMLEESKRSEARATAASLQKKIADLKTVLGALGSKKKLTLCSDSTDTHCVTDPDLRIFVLSSLLSLARCEEEVETTCPCMKTAKKVKEKLESQKLKEIPQVLQKPIIIRAQELLAKESCSRLLQLVAEKALPVSQDLNPSMVKLVDRKLPPIQKGGGKFDPSKPTRKIAHQDERAEREELPCFLTIEAAFQLASSFDVPVVITQVEMEHRFEQKEGALKATKSFCKAVIGDHGKAILKKCLPPSENQPVIVVEGYMSKCLPHHELHHGEDIDFASFIQMNAASHPQYTDGGDSPEERACERELMEKSGLSKKICAKLAELDVASQEVGCSKENPSTFCTFHVVASTTEEEHLNTIEEVTTQMSSLAINSPGEGGVP